MNPPGAGVIIPPRRCCDRVKEGRDTAITADGPRGPHCRGVFNSWGRFVLPLPFSRAVVIYGEPFTVGPDDDGEAARLILEERLNAITR